MCSMAASPRPSRCRRFPAKSCSTWNAPQAASGSNRIKTSHFTFPRAPLRQIYAASGYEASVANLAQLDSSGIGQGSSLQTAHLTGNAVDGYVATLRIAVNG